MEKIFVDTDIIMDLLAKREPHYQFAAELFSLADQGKIQICISPLSFYNISYIVFRNYNSSKSRNNLLKFKTLVHFLPVNDKVIDLTLTSDFKDFEDGIQYFTALEHNVNILITRNLKEYKTAEITILTAEQYLKK